MKESVLYIYSSHSSFIQKDIDFLSIKYVVKSPKHHWVNKALTPFRFLQQLIFLFRSLPSAKAVFIMFGGYWAFLPTLLGRLLNKPVYIILGGTDCVSFPSINYGSLRKPVLSTFIKWSYQLATKLLPVDESLVYQDYNYYKDSVHRYQGYKYFFPNISTNHEVIYNGFDPILFKEPKRQKISNSFIVVAYIPNMMRFKLKGIDIILSLAELFQECSFTIVGIQKTVTDQLNNIPENLNCLPFLPQEKFKDNLLQNEFVLQLSISEGFPNALCEAMLSGCIPIGSSVGAIPHIIEDTGFIIESSDLKYIEKEFRLILKLDQEKRKTLAHKARSRIIDNFHIDKRKKSFEALIPNSPE